MSREKVKEIAASAMENAIQKFRVRPVINESALIVNTKGKHEVLKGKQRPAFAWVEGPARVKLNVTAAARLSKIHPDPDVRINRVTKVRAAVAKGTKTVYIWLTDDDDIEGLDVTYQERAVIFNLIDLLAPLKLTVETGYEESFALEFSTPGEAVYPALKFDMGVRLERKVSAAARARAKRAAEKKKQAQLAAAKKQPQGNQAPAEPEAAADLTPESPPQQEADE